MKLLLIMPDERPWCFIYTERNFKRETYFVPFHYFLGIVYLACHFSDCRSVCLGTKQVLIERWQMYRTKKIWYIEEQKTVKVPGEDKVFTKNWADWGEN